MLGYTSNILHQLTYEYTLEGFVCRQNQQYMFTGFKGKVSGVYMYVMALHCNTRVPFDRGIVKLFCSYSFDLLK